MSNERNYQTFKKGIIYIIELISRAPIMRTLATILGILFSILTFLSHLSPSLLVPFLNPVRHFVLEPLSVNAYSWKMFSGGNFQTTISRLIIIDPISEKKNFIQLQGLGMGYIPSGVDSVINSLTSDSIPLYEKGYMCSLCTEFKSGTTIEFQKSFIPWKRLADHHIDETNVSYKTTNKIVCPCEK